MVMDASRVGARRGSALALTAGPDGPGTLEVARRARLQDTL